MDNDIHMCVAIFHLNTSNIIRYDEQIMLEGSFVIIGIERLKVELFVPGLPCLSFTPFLTLFCYQSY